MIFQIDAMVNEVLELNSNSDLIFESQGLLALASGSNNHCTGKRNLNLRPDENNHHHQQQQQPHQKHQRERHFLDSDGEGDNDHDDNNININVDERSPHENLSWTFFEEISSLDKHLRSEVSLEETFHFRN